ncbi:alcohol dehydrogenase catalytic domain-containing protein [Paenibacillus sp. JCM 10914]|uniref:alcohol dehydrogenase catalytic domain-containing protein n=1 Tax=Paenibacillus sp. JCM 10914 TaxID=1236974 RepID=UPI0003CC9917|nr:alcohol dehydrogenase catalytic domain-containing protein [Paenibacillus sp. JCM 10914]GAE09468.1 putative dehydrogenase [Paenibacillus sp. JCM 10914]
MKTESSPSAKIRSRTYTLTDPHAVKDEWAEREVRDGWVAVEPTLASICHADLRYFGGQRRPEMLEKKLPMALLHEGIGIVKESHAQSRVLGERVAIVPYVPGYLMQGVEPAECCDACSGNIPANYCANSKFLGSGYDGIAQSRVVVPQENAIPIPDHVPDEIAVLAELCSVSFRALRRVKDRLENATVAVFGDGPVGYMTAAALRYGFGVAPERLIVFGAVPEKLKPFYFAEARQVQQYDFAGSSKVDIVVECTGGKFSESALNQGIQLLKPCGDLIALGVSEEFVPLNTRDILEKGIRMYGSSRSTALDFHEVLEAMGNVEYQRALRQLVPEEYTVVRRADDFVGAMESALSHRDWKKSYLNFSW